MTRTFMAGTLIVLFTALSCSYSDEAEVATAAQESAWLAEGAAIVAPYKLELKAALMASLADGPAEAIDVCRLQAPRISQDLAVNGIQIGRTSHRLRNPDNAPRDWVRPLLADYAQGNGEPQAQVTLLPGDRIGYVEPITVMAPCLLCHGSEIPSKAAQRITELYPEDEATGFAADDFRGLFWVEFPATP